MKVYEAVAQTLVDHDVEIVFGLMGDGNLKLIPHLMDAHGIRFLSSRHESAAIAMADGYARVTGRPGIATVTQGPGLTNALTPLISARKAATPLVLLSGDTPLAVPGLPQDTDQAAIWRAAGVPEQAFTAADGPAAVAAAIAAARTRPGPVGISMPTDVQDQDWAGSLPQRAEAAGVAADGALPPDAGAVREAAALLAASERPVVLAGRGAIRAGAREALEELAEATGALLATSLPAKGWFRGHPWHIGVCGGLATPLAVDLLRDADVVVAVGASVNTFTSKAGTLFRPPTTLVHVDTDATAIGATTPAALGIVGDARETAVALRDALGDGEPRRGYRTAAVRERLDRFDLAAAHEDRSRPGALDPRTVCARLDAVLPAERNVVTDGGHFCGFPAGYLSVPEPSAFVFALDFGAVGLGLGTAMGVALGRPDRITVLGIGDGGLMMSLGDLDTAVRGRIPLLILVLDDGAYGAEMHFLQMLGLPDAASRFPTPDLAGIARGMGADAMTVTDLPQLEEVAERAATLAGPLLVHVPVNPDVRAEWLEEAFARVLDA